MVEDDGQDVLLARASRRAEEGAAGAQARAHGTDPEDYRVDGEWTTPPAELPAAVQSVFGDKAAEMWQRALARETEPTVPAEMGLIRFRG